MPGDFKGTCCGCQAGQAAVFPAQRTTSGRQSPCPAYRLPHPPRLLQVPIDAKKLNSEAAAAAAAAPRKRGPRPSRKEAEENAVRRVSCRPNEKNKLSSLIVWRVGGHLRGWP